MKHSKIYCLVLLLWCVCVSAQTTNPTDRLQRGGARVQVNADGSIDIIAASGKTVNITPGVTATIQNSTKAALPAAATNTGKLYRVTDDIRGFWTSNGSNWYSITGVANAGDFGVKGDGTNEQATIQAMFTALPEDAIVLFPKSATPYGVGAGITLTKGVRILGYGATLSATAGGTVITINPTASGKTFQLEGLAITGGAMGINLAGPVGGYVSRASSLRDLRITGFTNTGVRVATGVIGSQHSNLDIEAAGSYGLWIEGDSLAIASQWSGVRTVSTTVAGVYLKSTPPGPDMAGITFVNLISESNAGPGMYAYSVRTNLISAHFENNGTGGTNVPDIYMDGNGVNRTEVLLQGGYFGSPNAAQNNVRVFFNANLQSLRTYSTRWRSVDIIDANNKLPASTIYFSDLHEEPVVNNYTGGTIKRENVSGIETSGALKGNNVVTSSTVLAGGQIESTAGGFKFPDGTTQTTAASIYTNLWQPDANTLHQRNGTNAQKFNIARSYTDSLNYSQGWIRTWPGNSFAVGTEWAGTGAALPLEFYTNNTGRWWIGATDGHLQAYTDNTYDIGLSANFRPRRIYVGTGIVFPNGTELTSAQGYSNLFQTDANNLQQRNGTNPQTFGVYNTYASGSDYERGALRWDTNQFIVGTQSAGTGITRTMSLQGGGSVFEVGSASAASNWGIGSGGHFLAGADNTYDIGASGANRPRNIYTAGAILAPNGSASAPSYSFSNSTGTGIYWDTVAMQFPVGGSVGLRLQASSAQFFQGAAGELRLNNDSSLSFSPSTGAGDVILRRDAANTLALRNGTNAQTFNNYFSYVDASNHSRLAFLHGGGYHQIRGEAAGTGTTLGLAFGVSNSTQWAINTSGHWIALTDNSFDIGIGASGANRPRNIYAANNIAAAGDLSLGATGYLRFGARSYVNSPNDGVFTLLDSVATSFNRLQFGGTTSSFPALKRNAATLETKLADDSAYAQHVASSFKQSSGPTWTSGSGAPSGTCTTGSLYSRTDGSANTTLYVCESTAWAAK